MYIYVYVGTCLHPSPLHVPYLSVPITPPPSLNFPQQQSVSELLEFSPADALQLVATGKATYYLGDHKVGKGVVVKVSVFVFKSTD